MFHLLVNLLVCLGFLFFAVFRAQRYMLYFQQDEYDASRFIRWMGEHRAFDIRLSAVLLLLGLVSLISAAELPALARLFAGLSLFFFGFLDRRELARAKKRLNLTARVKRILGVALGLLVLFALVAWVTGAHPLVLLIGVQAVPFCLVLGNLLLDPYEKSVQQRFRREAEDKLKRISPRIVAITGSFGKTSVKHILGHVLSLASRAAHTPGSVNTVMGIVRMVREKLPEDTENFVVEMGAYGPGSISRLCELTPPDFGIITAIGEAHYERFKTLDTVARAKFELAEHVLGRGGRMVIDESVLDQPHARDFVARQRDRFILCGDSAAADYRIVSTRETPEGLGVQIVRRGETFDLQVPLYGPTHARNIAMAFAAAEGLGMPASSIVLALRSAPPIAHRLEVKREPSGALIIDDAYNSNPAGFASALKVLDQLAAGQRRRILVTPGMVELGARHEAAHAEIGALAARSADTVIAVSPERIPSFVAAVRGGSPAPDVLEMESFAKAREWLAANMTGNDVVLIENDLPDLHGAVPRF